MKMVAEAIMYIDWQNVKRSKQEAEGYPDTGYDSYATMTYTIKSINSCLKMPGKYDENSA